MSYPDAPVLICAMPTPSANASLARPVNGSSRVSAGVDAEADEIAILQRREHRADEDIEIVSGVGAIAPDHLVDDAVDRVIALMGHGNPVARRAGERNACIVVLLVVEGLAVVPDADLVRAGQRVARLRLGVGIGRARS